MSLLQSYSVSSKTLFALISTGGPGGSRFVCFTLLSYLYAHSFFDVFLQDVFLILSLNIIFCQSYTVFFYRNKYRQRFSYLLSSSFLSLLLSIVVLIFMRKSSGLLMPIVILLSSLHFYFFYRIYLLANSKFKECAILEFLFFLLFFLSIDFDFFRLIDFSFYSLYSFSLLGSLVFTILLFFNPVKIASDFDFFSFELTRSAFNMAISNLSGTAVIFLIPYVLGYFNLIGYASIFSLSLSFAMLIYLIPRTYATKFLPLISNATEAEVAMMNLKYNKIVCLSTLVMFLGLILYSYFILDNVGGEVYLSSALLSFLMMANQFNFIYSHALVIKGGESILRNTHLKSAFFIFLGFWMLFVFGNDFAGALTFTIILMLVIISCIFRGEMFRRNYFSLIERKGE